jgi:thiamine biosynthesis lipoprotein
MNTEITYKAFGEKAALAVSEAKTVLMRLENILSRFMPNSEVSMINQHAGKGYVSDCLIKTLQKYGVVSAFINIGGNVSTLGNKLDGSSWSVGIRHPRHYSCLIGAVKVTGKAVVTSGDYERYFIDRAGKRRHHILDPTTGYPAESGLISITVVADSAMIADALSTAIFVAGMEKGLRYLAQFPGIDVVLVDNCQQVFITQGLRFIVK